MVTGLDRSLRLIVHTALSRIAVAVRSEEDGHRAEWRGDRRTFSGLTWVDRVTAGAIFVAGIGVAQIVGRLVRRAIDRTGAGDFVGTVLGRLG